MRTNFWDSFNQGLQSGQAIWKANAERNLQGDIAKAAKTDQTVDRADNDMVVAAAQGLAPGQTMSWNAETQSYVTPEGEQYAAKLPSYSLGGVTRNTEFSPTEVNAARRQAMGDTYLKYGLADKADELYTRGQQMELSGLQLRKAQGELDDADAFKADQSHLFEVATTARAVEAQAKALLAKGDKLGAARLVADFRTNVIKDPRAIQVTDAGELIGYENGEPIGVRSINDPAVLNELVNGVRGSVADYSNAVLSKHMRTPEQVAAFQNQLWQQGNEGLKTGAYIRNLDSEITNRGERLKLDKRELDEVKIPEAKSQQSYRSGTLANQRREIDQKAPLVQAQTGYYQAGAAGQRLANIGLQSADGVGTKSGTGTPRNTGLTPQNQMKFNEEAEAYVQGLQGSETLTPQQREFAKQEYLARSYPNYFQAPSNVDYSAAADAAFR